MFAKKIYKNDPECLELKVNALATQCDDIPWIERGYLSIFDLKQSRSYESLMERCRPGIILKFGRNQNYS